MKRILVQAGHKPPLQPGHLTQTGAPGERELVSDIQAALCRMLDRDDNFEPIPKPGKLDDSTQCDAALFLHADGAAPSAHGYSFGFPDDPVNEKLAEMIADEFEKLPGHPAPRRQDNGTDDEHFYYGFTHTHTPGPEVLIEHGFVTNPTEMAWMKAHIKDLARAEHAALRRFFGLAPAPDAHPHPPHADPHPPMPAAQPRTGAVTPDTTLLGGSHAPARKAVAFLLSQDHGDYSDNDVRHIVANYYATAPAVGLDPLIVVAQMSEETGHLTSFWSQRPRRNPAGIGVTGEPGQGVSFPDWKTAVRAHTGRLLAYAIPKGSENPAQAALIEEALSFRPLGDEHRGVAPTLKGLVHQWAADPNYDKVLSAVANQIRTHAG
ncbi:MAG TPA: N-acetylmuramoyl-L-alanine amidase [Thermoleophilaceae bacterium]|jgi:hypothetical protein